MMLAVGGQPLLTRLEAQAEDRARIAAGLPGIVLMENAGRGATEVLLGRLGERARRALIVGGTGQNGGDAWVVARHLLARGCQPVPVLVGRREAVRGDASIALAALEGLGTTVHAWPADADLEGRLRAWAPSCIVDGLFGTGLDRPLEGGMRTVLESLEALGLPILALDLPSGVCADTGAVLGRALPADVTVTFHAMKRGLALHPGAGLAGEVVVVGLGCPPPPPGPARWVQLADLRIAPRVAHMHKGRAGHVLVVGGGPGTTGAALLAARAAMRSGAGLVTVAARGVGGRQALEARVLEVMTREIPEALEAGVQAILAGGCDAAVLGPGLGLDPATRQFAVRLALEHPEPMVLDADALRALAREGALGALTGAKGPRVLTPHPGEGAELLGCSIPDAERDRVASALELSRRCGHPVVWKGAGSVVASAGHVAVIGEGTPALATAGTGDVLAGAIAALLVAAPPVDAAVAGAVLHGAAGSLAARGRDRGVFAGEVADALADVIRSVSAEPRRR